MDVLNFAIYYRLTLSEGGAYNIGYDERLRANRQSLIPVDSDLELRLTLHSMEFVSGISIVPHHSVLRYPGFVTRSIAIEKPIILVTM